MTFLDTKLEDSLFIREFNEDVDVTELYWHRDKLDREVEVLEGEGWKLQFDNQLPYELKVGDVCFIPAMIFHRLWKGNSKLKLKIRES